jgi:transcriptional regulator with XRE-family HTH domain
LPTTRSQYGSDIPEILRALKGLLKSQGLTYQAVADTLKISRITVKRYLSGRGLTVGALEKLCSVVGLTLADITEIAKYRQDDSKGYLTVTQEEELFAQPFLAIIFILLSRGWSPDQLKAEFKLNDVELDGYLIKLDKLKLIELHPFGRIRMLVGHPFQVIPGRPLSRGFDRYVKDDLFRTDVLSNDVTYRYNYFKMSRGSQQKFTTMLDDLLKATEQLTVQERNLPSDAASWQSVFVLVSPVKLDRHR